MKIKKHRLDPLSAPDISVGVESQLFMDLSKRITGNTAIVFVSCNVGNGLAPDLSDKYKITVYASKDMIKLIGQPGVYDGAFALSIRAEFYKFTHTNQ